MVTERKIFADKKYINFTHYKGSNDKLLVMLHGFMSDRTEDGRFTSLAEKMYECGWSSVIIQYEGRLRDYTQFTLSGAVEVVESVIASVAVPYDNISIVGYSLGAVISAMLIQKHPEIKQFISYAGYLKSYNRFFGENDLVKCCLNRNPILTNSLFNEQIPVTTDFCRELLQFDSKIPFLGYPGKFFIIHGLYDQVIQLQEIQAWLSDLSENITYLVLPTDHSFGGWEGHEFYDKELSDFVVEVTKQYLIHNED